MSSNICNDTQGESHALHEFCLNQNYLYKEINNSSALHGMLMKPIIKYTDNKTIQFGNIQAKLTILTSWDTPVFKIYYLYTVCGFKYSTMRVGLPRITWSVMIKHSISICFMPAVCVINVSLLKEWKQVDSSVWTNVTAMKH